MNLTRIFDILVIGGGINGAGIACDAAGRGLSVLLCEQDDLGGRTSSASSKMIHGGLRYLEQYEFRLVRESLAEREVLRAKAPHLIAPLRLILPHAHTTRPAWLIRAGLFIYDHLSRRQTLPGCEKIDLQRHPAGRVLVPSLRTAFAYSDCRVDDSRLVIANALAARDKGASILTRHRVVRAERKISQWQVTLRNEQTAETLNVSAKALVNAAGAHVESVLGTTGQALQRNRVRLVKGSHIVVPRLFDGPEAFLLQNPDGRVIFVIPFERDFSLIGTTDVAVDSPEDGSTINPDETAYLCQSVNRYFQRQLAPSDVIWSYAGVRPLFDDGKADASSVTRDYVLELDAPGADAPLLSVFGGKITTFRRLAEAACRDLAPFLPDMGKAWTAKQPLPGGDVDPAILIAELTRQRPGVAPGIVHGLVTRHGSRAAKILGEARTTADLGQLFGGGLTAREVDYLRAEEWAMTADDILWRRTKAGLHITGEARRSLETYLKSLAKAAA